MLVTTKNGTQVEMTVSEAIALGLFSDGAAPAGAQQESTPAPATPTAAQKPATKLVVNMDTTYGNAWEPIVHANTAFMVTVSTKNRVARLAALRRFVLNRGMKLAAKRVVDNDVATTYRVKLTKTKTAN